MGKRKAEDAGHRAHRKQKMDASEPHIEASKQPIASNKFKNKEKVLVLGTRGITYRWVLQASSISQTGHVR